jgi:hypothetical protein
MLVHTWDEISEEWAAHNLDIESRDPIEINRALGSALVSYHPIEGDAPDGFRVTASNWTGPVLTITTRDGLGHLAIIVVVY